MRHAIDAARKAIGYAKSAERHDLDTNEMLAFTWQKAIALRHRLAHGYFDVNLNVVWETVLHRLPELVALLEKASADAAP
jgi:uncharacterized protein with HEPN domain